MYGSVPLRVQEGNTEHSSNPVERPAVREKGRREVRVHNSPDAMRQHLPHSTFISGNILPAPVRAKAGLGGWTPPTRVEVMAMSSYTSDPAQSVAMSADTDGLPPRLGIDRFHAPRQHTSITRQRYTDSPLRSASF